MKKSAQIISYLLMIALIVLIAVVLIVFVGADVGKAFSSFFMGVFGSTYAISEVLVKATPLILTGVGVAVAFRSGFTNIGAEGQLYIGAIAATFVALNFKNLSAIILIPLMIVAGFVFGGIWSLIPGILKAKFGISEVINTIMFNYIAINILGILLRSSLQDPDNPLPISPQFPKGAILPQIFGATSRVHAGLIVALIMTALVYVFVWRTPYGFQMRAVGLNKRASLCAGIPVNRSIILSSIISGGLAGIAGMCEVSGLHYQLVEGFSANYGYMAVIVALLGKNHPAGVIASAIGIAILQVGSLSMQRSAGVPASISSILIGAIVLLILGRSTIFSFLKKDKKEELKI